MQGCVFLALRASFLARYKKRKKTRELKTNVFAISCDCILISKIVPIVWLGIIFTCVFLTSFVLVLGNFAMPIIVHMLSFSCRFSCAVYYNGNVAIFVPLYSIHMLLFDQL